jgi:1-acyl-sn-glycerol-3-phosphate acyltransferase
MKIMKIMSNISVFARTFVSYVFGGCITLVLGPCIVLMFLLPDRYRYDNRLLFWLLDTFYKGILAATFMPIAVQGEEHIPTAPAIIIANHQSALDIPLVASTLQGFSHTWYVLSYYLRYPILGWMIRRMGIALDRDNTAKVAQDFIRGIRLVEGKQRHIIVFPEGGRFNDGSVHRFFSGFAIIARLLQRPVVPIMLKGSGKVYPPKSFLIHEWPLEIVIGQPFIYGVEETDSQFVERVHAWFTSQN